MRGKRCPQPGRKHVTAIFVSVSVRKLLDRFQVSEHVRTGYPVTLTAITERLIVEGIKQAARDAEEMRRDM